LNRIFFDLIVKDFKKSQESKPLLRTVLQTATCSYWDTVLYCISYI